MSKKAVLAFAQHIESDAGLRAEVQAIDPNMGKAEALTALCAIASRYELGLNASELEQEVDELGELELDTVVGGGSTVTTASSSFSGRLSEGSGLQAIKGAVCPC